MFSNIKKELSLFLFFLTNVFYRDQYSTIKQKAGNIKKNNTARVFMTMLLSVVIAYGSISVYAAASEQKAKPKEVAEVTQSVEIDPNIAKLLEITEKQKSIIEGYEKKFDEQSAIISELKEEVVLLASEKKAIVDESKDNEQSLQERILSLEKELAKTSAEKHQVKVVEVVKTQKTSNVFNSIMESY